MGCALSLQKKTKLPKKRPEHYVPSYGSLRPIKRPGFSVVHCKRSSPTQRNCTQIHENILEEYSTLGFLIGGKAFPDPEIVFKVKDDSKDDVAEMVSKLPACVQYEGLHDHGFHLFTIDAELYGKEVELSDSIVEGISALTGQGECVIVFQHHLNVAYLPNPSGHARDFFDSLCTRLGDRLRSLVFFNPSWYVQVCLDIQARTGRHFFSEAAMRKLKFASDPIQLAKMTGFPGQIKLN